MSNVISPPNLVTSRLYVPNTIDIESVSCVSIKNNDSILLTYNNGNVYELTYNNLIKDYYITSYGSHDLSCSDIELTHDFYYRNDLADILLCFLVIVIIAFWFPYKIFSRAFGRWLKV